jgi:hypothetical protein
MSKNDNKVAAIEKARNYRAAKAASVPPWLSEYDRKLMKAFERFSKDMSEANQRTFNVDHISPIQGEGFCGLHVPWNLQIIDESTNKSKGNIPYRKAPDGPHLHEPGSILLIDEQGRTIEEQLKHAQFFSYKGKRLKRTVFNVNLSKTSDEPTEAAAAQFIEDLREEHSDDLERIAKEVLLTVNILQTNTAQLFLKHVNEHYKTFTKNVDNGGRSAPIQINFSGVDLSKLTSYKQAERIKGDTDEDGK